MEGFLRVDNATNLPGSPTNSFLADEVASICPLITPSPPTNDLINPLPEPSAPNLGIGLELATKLQHVQDDEKADSASSSSSALAEPACAQLLNHRNVYHHMTKTEETEAQETNGRTQQLQLTFRNPPDNYFFMSWNWPLIRKISLWIFMSGLVAMVALVIAMIYNLPTTCNPQTQWYQGNVFYEVFPPSFYKKDNRNMMGDLKGLSNKTQYFVDLGVKSVRLNSIFTTPDYPYDFENVTSLINIQPTLGKLSDFKNLAKTLKSKNISLLLDLHVYPLVERLPYRKTASTRNETNAEPVRDMIEEAILYWISYGVDGFFLKGLEHLVDDPNFVSSLRIWKKILGADRILIVSDTAVNKASQTVMNILLNNVDLVDIKLDLTGGAAAVSQKIGSLQNGTLFSKPSMPWIHWSLGNVHSRRLANVLPYGNGTLGATLLQLMLPGTPSIFYGDEIGLHEIVDSGNEQQDIKHLHQLHMMPWQNEKRLVDWINSEAVHAEYELFKPISEMAAEREKSPSIYMNSVYKEGVNKANAEVKYAEKELLVVQRWYPRRKAYVVVCNLGSKQLSADLSTFLYSGEIVVGPRADSIADSISFKDVSLWPGESVVIKLD